MNPAFILICLIGIVALWFSSSGIYKFIGKFICKIGKDAIDELKDIDNKTDSKKSEREE